MQKQIQQSCLILTFNQSALHVTLPLKVNKSVNSSHDIGTYFMSLSAQILKPGIGTETRHPYKEPISPSLNYMIEGDMIICWRCGGNLPLLYFCPKQGCVSNSHLGKRLKVNRRGGLKSERGASASPVCFAVGSMRNVLKRSC